MLVLAPSIEPIANITSITNDDLKYISGISDSDLFLNRAINASSNEAEPDLPASTAFPQLSCLLTPVLILESASPASQVAKGNHESNCLSQQNGSNIASEVVIEKQKCSSNEQGQFNPALKQATPFSRPLFREFILST
jgi:hypothetical protein